MKSSDNLEEKDDIKSTECLEKNNEKDIEQKEKNKIPQHVQIR